MFHALEVLIPSTPTSNTSQKIAAFTPRPPKAPYAETKPATPPADAPAAAEPAAPAAAATETAAAEAPRIAETKNSGNGGMDFTDEQDQQLLSLKGVGQSWKYISMTLDKSVGDVKHRYHLIKHRDVAGNAKEPVNDKAAKAAEAKAKGLAAKAAKEEERKAKARAGQGAAHAQAAQAQARAQGTAAQNQMPGASPGNQYVLMEDEFFSFSDLQLIARLVQKEQEQLWLRVASRFYDHTERRIHPDDIRDKVQGRPSHDV
ncbi:hypothetical protein W97_00274 [Coniosporium apollinis CBS 100218]|uniref:Myb-like domain-containing protein n=1 Tax=Coniosporium apollinis (strain CBS 100218) TaxID=1168221 RepID=R7YGQ4_CONA1|nr:uncharacterized protein W97_00274 [Coniosporium apollinis CBS 100218]EON61063.1 hypothetical protein W97_00274 [Coniosporium apollinis CBS 100218]